MMKEGKTNMDQGVIPDACPGVHESFLSFFTGLIGGISPGAFRILDAGAGYGALTRSLHERGFRVSACDLSPERYRYSKVECRQADCARNLPYPDGSFDAVIALEIIEHLIDFESFYRECHRVLAPGGRLVLSTPNILSLKSRLQYFLTGYFYSFHPLPRGIYDGLQHVTPITFQQVRYISEKHGFQVEAVSVDRYQSTSKILLGLAPLLHAYSAAVRIHNNVHNSRDLLLGRILFIALKKAGEGGGR